MFTCLFPPPNWKQLQIQNYILLLFPHRLILNAEEMNENTATSIYICVARQNFAYFNKLFRDFPGGPVVKTSPSKARGVGSIPSQRDMIPRAWGKKKQKQKKTKPKA